MTEPITNQRTGGRNNETTNTRGTKEKPYEVPNERTK